MCIRDRAYVPLFSENTILLFQYAFGNRYSTVPYEKEAVMDKPDLEERCFELYPDHPMLRLSACQEIIGRGIEDEKEAGLLEDAMEEGRLQPLYQRQLLSRIIEYYQAQASDGEEEEGGDYLARLDKRMLTKKERLAICETLIKRNYVEEDVYKRQEYGVADDYFETHDIHLHIPEGAVPKDGPSAGITMATAMLSAVTGRKVDAKLAMTGEITLRGRVLPIGGLKAKILAARLAHMKRVLVPDKNKPDIAELSKEITKGLESIFVKTIPEVLAESLVDSENRKESV